MASTSPPPILAPLLAALALAPAACAVPAIQAGEPADERRPVAVRAGRASVVLRPLVREASRALHFFQGEIGNQLQRADIDHLVVKLYTWDGSTETEVAAVDVPERLLDAPITLSRLQGATTYRARGFAYQAPGTAAADLISVQDATTYGEVTVENDDTPSAAYVPVQLASRARLLVVSWVGGGVAGFRDAGGSAARLNRPRGIAFDADTGLLYVAEYQNNRVRVVAPSGLVTTLAGNGAFAADDGLTGAATTFQFPMAVAVAGGFAYVADGGNHLVRKVAIADGATTTLAGDGTGVGGFADGTGTGASFDWPGGVAVDGDGNVFVGDSANHRIRRITPGGVVTTLAGSAVPGLVDGLGAAASFTSPHGLAFGPDGALYVADTGNHAIRRIELGPAGARVETVAGTGTAGTTDGQGSGAEFNQPEGLAVDPRGRIFVADTGNATIRAISRNRTVRTIAGGYAGSDYDGPAQEAGFNYPAGIAVGPDGVLYVGDTENHKIRRVL